MTNLQSYEGREPAGFRDASSPGELTRNPVAETARAILAALRRRWLSFLAVFIFVMGAVVALTLSLTPKYGAVASLVVNSRILNVSNTENAAVTGPSSGDGAVPTEMEIMRSDAVAGRVAESVANKQLAGFSETVAGKSGPTAVSAIKSNIKGNLSIDRSGPSNVVTVTFLSTDPQTAKTVADEVAKQYLATKLNTRQTAAAATDVNLDRELARMRTEVAETEAKVAAYKGANNLLTAQSVPISEQEASTYKLQQAAARATLAEEQARLNTARSQLARGSVGDDVGEALGSSVIGGLRAQRAQVSAQLAELKTRYRSDYPDVIKTQSQLDDIDQAIRSEIQRVVSNLQARVAVASSRAATADSIATQATGVLQTNNNASVKLAELERNAEAIRSNYATMLSRKTAIATQAGVTDEDARVFSPAQLPTRPAFPNKPLNVIIGFFIACLTAGLVVWLLQIFDRGIVSSRDVENALGLTHFVNVPTVASVARREERDVAPQDYVVQRPMSIMTEALRSLRLILDANEPGSSSVIGITSSAPNEGKTTLAICLARTCAAGGTRTLLIDGDVRKPSVAKYLGLNPTAGLTEVLRREVDLSAVLIEDEASGLFILPTLSSAFTPDTLLSGKNVAELLAQAGKVFELIIIDTAPALATVDARILLQQVDHVVMAIRWNKTLVPTVKSALKRMASSGIQPSGVVLTQVDMKALSTYAYSDIDHNYRNYASYYQN